MQGFTVLVSVAVATFPLLSPAQPALTPLAAPLLNAVRAEHFEQVMDFGPGSEDSPGVAHPIAHPPNLDFAVLQLDAEGRAVTWADVLLSRDYPTGVAVPVDLEHGASCVRFLRWDIARFNGGTFRLTGTPLSHEGWTNEPPLTPDDDLVPGRTAAPYQFMAPYPASLFKLMVAFHVLRMVQVGSVTLDTEYTSAPPDTVPETRPLRAWLDPMITQSDNHCTAALLKMLHDRREIEPLNREFRELGLGTLQIHGTNPANGLDWQPGQIHMTAFDTVRLLWLIEGGPGVLWHAPDGRAITADWLSPGPRSFLKKILLEQGFNEALSTANYPGAPYIHPGIPSHVAERWIQPATGHVIVEGVDYGVDLRRANPLAPVDFAHKTGLTYNYGSDAGIVRSRPGQPFRHYIVALLTNLGYRYTDDALAHRTTFPALDTNAPVSYTQRIPDLGAAVDRLMLPVPHQ